MRAEGIVVAVEGGMAIVSVVQQSACSGCSASCASCHKKVCHKISIENTISADVGDEVWVESPPLRILLICFLVFVLPCVLTGVACALLGKHVSGLPLALISIAAFAISFALLYLTLGKKIIAGNEYRLVKKY